MERFVQKWDGKVSNNYAKRVEKGPKIEPKWVQKSSKIDTEIEVGKKFEKVSLRIRLGFGPDYRLSTKNGPKWYPKNDEKVGAEKVCQNDAKGPKRDAKCFQNGSQNLRKSILKTMPKRDGKNNGKTLKDETVES